MLPAFDPRPWGTHDLSPIYPNHKFEEKIGEAWLSGDDCKVANGPFTGKTLAQLSEEYQRELVGDAARDSTRFPLLLKFLFPHEKLSVQVHPDDAQALRVGQPWGKTECWYIAHAKPGAQIALGLKPGVTVQQLEEAIHRKAAFQAPAAPGAPPAARLAPFATGAPQIWPTHEPFPLPPATAAFV